MQLIIETSNTNRAGDLQNAYNDAMNAINRASFIERLNNNMPDTIVGVGGNHIYVAEKDGTRLGLITNPLN
tara:strand:- start:477 stop:689 length:213 start_codon:yes stop_codon:yes gene_type:complete